MGRIRIGALLVLVVAAAAFAGCSEDGDLVIKNECQTEFEGYVDNVFVQIAAGDQTSQTIYIGKTLLIVGPSDIDVDIAGSAKTKRPFIEKIAVKSGETTTYVIDDDAGALQFQNAYKLQINEIRVKLHDNEEFGDNLLGKNQALAPGTARAFQLDGGTWDVLVNYGREGILDTVSSVPIDIGQVVAISWIPGFEYLVPGLDRLPR